MAKYLLKRGYTVFPHPVWLEEYPIITSGLSLNRYLQKHENFPHIKNEGYATRINRFLTTDDKDKDKIKIEKQNGKLILFNDIWQWCFSPEWEKIAQRKSELTTTIKNGKKIVIPKGEVLTLAEQETGQRILWLLDYGLPENWKAQMEGKEFGRLKSFYNGY